MSTYLTKATIESHVEVMLEADNHKACKRELVHYLNSKGYTNVKVKYIKTSFVDSDGLDYDLDLLDDI